MSSVGNYNCRSSHGGVAGPLYFDQSIFNSAGSNYYRYLLDTKIPCNHNVVLVGWNNSYSRDNFSESNGHKPYIDGALIVKNSWGGEGENEWPDGDDGYFYISMDTLRYSPNTAFADVAEPIYKYTYQYDLLGHVTDIEFDTPGDTSECTYANVFEAENQKDTIDNLQAVGLVLPYDQLGQCGFNYTIDVYTDLTNGNIPTSGIHAAGPITGQGWYQYSGYYTQCLPSPVQINDGSKFSVVVKNSRYPFYHKCGYAVETRMLPGPNNPKISTLNASSKLGESFELTTSGWQDLKTAYPGETLNACIKAFTDGNFDHYWKLKEALDDPTLNVSSDNGYNLNWTRVTDSHAPGINNDDAARSNWINTGERCHMEATVTGPTGISFYWAVSSDPGNSLKLYIDQDPKKPMAEWVAWKSIGGTVANPTVNPDFSLEK